MNKLLIFIAIIIVAAVAGVITLNKNNTVATAPKIPDISPTPIPAVRAATTAATITPNLTVTKQPASPSGIIMNAQTATIKTAKGNIVIKLYPQDAPKTVANFATLATRGYYNNLTFHRVVPDFVIQGGDPNGDGTGGTSIYGPTFEDELNPNTPSYQEGYREGVVAMANRGPNTNGSQFFIMLADNPSLPHSYTIFGKVTSGMDVVKLIQVGDKMLSVTAQ